MHRITSLGRDHGGVKARMFARVGVSRIRVLSLLTGVLLACDGGSDGPVGVDGGVGDGGPGGQGGFGLTGQGGKGGSLGFDGSVGPPPTPNPASHYILPGAARLVGLHGSACSNADPELPGQATKPDVGDRWCAFFIPGERLGRFELWVFNANEANRRAKATAGYKLPCDGSDAICKRLTANLWTGQPQVGPSHPFAHGFDGDTLIFHADALSGPTDLYKGPIYAWRPGWPDARRIGPSTAITCAGHPRAEVALCLANIEEDETKPIEYDLHAGPLPGAGGGELPKIDRIHPLNAQDVSKWRVGFSRDGSRLAYSTGTTDTDAEVLRIMNSADAATFLANKATAPVINDASRFIFSRDGSRVFYLDKFNYSDQGNPSGVLMTATVTNDAGGKPVFGTPAILQDKVGAFLTLGRANVDDGIGYFHDVAVGKGTLRLIKNLATPTEYLTVQGNISSALISGDGRFTLYSNDFDENTGTADLFIVGNANAKKDAAPTGCALQRGLRTDLYGSPFFDSSGLVLFTDDVDTQLLVGTGVAANPANCARAEAFAQKVDFWFTVGDQGLVYSDDTDIDVATIRYRELVGGNTLKTGGGVEIQKRADRIYSFTMPNFDVVIYQIDSGDAKVDGIYLFDIPAFPGGPPSPDGGAPDAGGDGGV